MAYDVVIIGSGPGGYVCAIKAAQLGLKTALVEKWATLGGTCVNIGCIPSKALLHATEMFAEAGHSFDALGIEISAPKFNLAKMMAHKDQVVGQNTKGLDFLMKKNKIDVLRGTGKILAAGKITVTGEDGKSQEVETKNIVIATGSDVAGIPGVEVDVDEKVIVSSTGALSLAKVPGHLVVVGGGVIGLELGSVWATTRRQGDRGGISRQHSWRHGRRSGEAVPAPARQAGLRHQDRVQGDRGRQGQEGRVR